MALAKRIMERFGGGIDVHSQKGVGTRVGLMFTAA
jgi:signal transduction histidine kinase